MHHAQKSQNSVETKDTLHHNLNPRHAPLYHLKKLQYNFHFILIFGYNELVKHVMRSM